MHTMHTFLQDGYILHPQDCTNDGGVIASKLGVSQYLVVPGVRSFHFFISVWSSLGIQSFNDRLSCSGA